MSDDARRAAQAAASDRWPEIIRWLKHNDHIVDRSDAAQYLTSIGDPVTEQTARRLLRAMAETGVLDLVEKGSGRRKDKYRLNITQWRAYWAELNGYLGD